MSSEFYYQKDEEDYIRGLGCHRQTGASELSRLELLKKYRATCLARVVWDGNLDQKETLSLIDYHIAVEKGARR